MIAVIGARLVRCVRLFARVEHSALKMIGSDIGDGGLGKIGGSAMKCWLLRLLLVWLNSGGMAPLDEEVVQVIFIFHRALSVYLRVPSTELGAQMFSSQDENR